MSAPPGGAAVAVLAGVIATAAVLCCVVRMAVGLVGAVQGLVLTHGAVTVVVAAAGGFVWVAMVAVFGIMIADVLRQ